MRTDRTIRRVAMVGLVCALGALAGGCSKRETQTVEQVQRMFAENMVQGIDFGLAGRVRARAYDEQTFRLLDVSIDAGESGIIHADYAEILVDTVKDTVSLRLRGVVSASKETGAMTETESLVTDPVPLRVDAVDGK
jgi:hypothetical protein